MTEQGRASRRKAGKSPIQAQLRLDGWAQRGSTGAQMENRRVIVDRGLPGELVVATLDRRRKPWRGVVEEVREPSPQRVSPPCPYYLRGCGGCQWQHLGYDAQLEAKRAFVDQQMEACAVDAPVSRVYPMSDPWRYRRTAAVAIGWEAGFRPRGRRGIVEIHDCLISHPLIGQLAHQLNQLLESFMLPNYHAKVWLDCTVVGSERQPALQVLVQSINGLTLEEHPELPDVAATIAAIEGVSTVAYRHRCGEPRPLVGDLMSLIEVAGRSMYVPAGSFFQTNLEMLELVLERMVSELRGVDVDQAADVYGGVGTFALALAPYVKRMTLIELDPLAVSAARRTAEERSLGNIDFISRHAERALLDLASLDFVVVDPPRSGLGDIVTGALVAQRPPLLFYVSCSPPSLARDLDALVSGGYKLRSLELFDFYPQTYHVESLAILEL